MKGQKRHIVVDTLGNLLAVLIHPANLHDTKMGAKIFQTALETFPSITGGSADAGYRGTTVTRIAERFGIHLDVVQKGETGWKVLPKRWIVERTFAWLDKSRRLAKAYEKSDASAVSMIYIAFSRIVLRRVCS